MKKVISILFALALVSCTPSSYQSASESSASDSVELKKQEAWESTHRLDSVEALLAEEGNEHDAEASASDKPARQYSEHELNAIMDTIGQRLSKCKELSGCISSYCTVANGIEVNFIYNTAERRRLFCQKVYDAPFLKFVGPESPIRMSKTGVRTPSAVPPESLQCTHSEICRARISHTDVKDRCKRYAGHQYSSHQRSFSSYSRDRHLYTQEQQLQ